MSKFAALYGTTSILTFMMPDYVSVVIGIFVALLGTYWLVWGNSFEGPVRTPFSKLSTHRPISANGEQC